VAFLDDDSTKRRLVLNGIHVVGNRTEIAAVAARFEADTLLLALPGASQDDITALADLGQDAGLDVKVLPSAHVLTSPTVQVTDIRDIALSDFLDRDEIRIEDGDVRTLLPLERHASAVAHTSRWLSSAQRPHIAIPSAGITKPDPIKPLPIVDSGGVPTNE
jgi:hypothetical protein